MSTGESVVMLCGWGVKAGWLLSYDVDKRVAKLCDPSLTRANLGSLGMRLAHITKRYKNALFTLT